MLSCCCETYPIDFLSLSKALRCKTIGQKNRAELFVLNENKETIRYEFHNGVKANLCNGNLV